MAGPSHAQLITDRLLIRPVSPADADAVYTECQDPQIQRWTTVPSPYLREHAEHYTGTHSPQAWATGAAATFAVTDLSSGALLACVGLHFDRGRDDGIADIGYWAGASARGRGVTTEAVAAICQWGFTSCGVERVDWYAEVGNVPSRRVAEKVGFTLEGTLRKFLRRSDGTRVDAWAGSLVSVEEIAVPVAVR